MIQISQKIEFSIDCYIVLTDYWQKIDYSQVIDYL